MADQKDENKPSINPSKDGPFLVKNLPEMKNSRGESIPTQPFMSLCRCGKSSNKPFCDGTHTSVGFKGDKSEDRVPDKTDNNEGKKISILDNNGVCSHAGYCDGNLPKVFWEHKDNKRIAKPDEEEPEKIIKVIRMCPSGALSYSINNVLYKDQKERKPMITVSKDGPYQVVGGPEFKDQDGNKPESKEHYTLCRCGGSKNKPFCDGTHWYVKFKDDRN